MTYICIYMHKKNERMLFAPTQADLEVVMLSEVSQTKTNITWYQLYLKSKKWYKWIYLQNRNRLTDIENKLMVTKGDSRSGEREINQKFGIKIWTLLYMKWVSQVMLVVMNPPANTEDEGSILGQEDPLEEEMTNQVFLPVESHGQRSLAGYSP